MFHEFDRVVLPDGRVGVVVEVFNGGEAYEVEYVPDDGLWEEDPKPYKAHELKPVE